MSLSKPNRPEDVCINCGTLFKYNKKAKSYGRQGFSSKLPSSQITIAQIISEEWATKTLIRSRHDKYICKPCLLTLKAIHTFREKANTSRLTFESKGAGMEHLWETSTVASPSPPSQATSPRPKRPRRADTQEPIRSKKKKQKVCILYTCQFHLKN